MDMGKKAFVFDTNFIIENLDLTSVVNSLQEKYTVYVPQVAIDERLSQKYIEWREKYNKLNSIQKEFSEIASIEENIDFSEKYKAVEKHTQEGYRKLFSDNIIPFSKDAETFCAIWNRVHEKLPPFRAIPKSGDKGFKDVLLWLSLIRFFKENGESEVVFITSDKDFLDNAEFLKNEFKEFTEKEIEIKGNEFYKEFVSLDESGIKEPAMPVSKNELDISSPSEEEITFIVAFLRNQDSSEVGVSTYSIKQELEKCGFSNVYFSLGLMNLEKKDFIVIGDEVDYNGNEYSAVKLTASGNDWVLKNTDTIYKADANTTEKVYSILDDELPF